MVSRGPYIGAATTIVSLNQMKSSLNDRYLVVNRLQIKQTHGEQHVFLVLIDGSGVGDSIGMLDHTDGLACVTLFCEVDVIERSNIIFVCVCPETYQ